MLAKYHCYGKLIRMSKNPVPEGQEQMWLAQTHWILPHDAADVNFNDPRLNHVTAYTVDIENVLTDGVAGGDPTIRPKGLLMLNRIAQSGRDILLLTGCKDEEFGWAVKNQAQQDLGIAYIPTMYRGLRSDGTRWPGKHDPAMFGMAGAALKRRHKEIGHIDDQLKSHLGAWRTNYGLHIWPTPFGEHEHPGVAMFRPLEMSIIRGLMAAHPRSRGPSFIERS